MSCAQDLSLQHITNVSWAYASLGVVAPRLVAALRCEVLRRAAAEQLSAQQLCNLMWSFAMLRVRHAAVLRTGRARLDSEHGSIRRLHAERKCSLTLWVAEARLSRRDQVVTPGLSS
jgi:hypothetical protein